MNKKILLIILILSLFLMCFPVLADNSYSDIDESKYISQIEQLTAIGIFSGDGDGRFNPQTEITRAEFAKIVCSLDIIGWDMANSGESPFKDLDSSHWAYGYIYYVTNRGFMAGYTDGTFRPDEPITVIEAVKVLLSYAGYDYQAVAYGGYPAGYETVARNNGIFKNINVASYEYAFREEIACIISNLLDLPLIKKIGVGSENYQYSKSGTVLYEKFGMVRGKGRVLACDSASVGVNAIASEGCINIEGVNIECDNDMSGYLGHKVTYIYEEDKETDERKLLYIADNDTEFIKISREDFISFSSGVLIYDLNGKEEKVNISSNADYIINNSNKAYTNGLIENLKLAEIKIIYSDASGEYDIVVIDSYTVVVADFINKNDKVIKDKYNPSLVLNLDENNYNKISIIKDGKNIEFNDIVKGDVLTALIGEYSVTCYVTKSVLSGRVESIDSENNIIIDNKEYKRNYYSHENNAIRAGQNVTVYFDFFGNIADVKSAYDDNYKIGYLIRIVDRVEAGENTVYGKLYLNDGNFLNIPFAENTHVNDISVNVASSQDIISKIGTSSKYDQLVTVKIVNEKIKYLNTAKTLAEFEEKKEDGLCLRFERKSRAFWSESMCYDWEIYVNSETPYMVVPADVENADDEDYSMADYKSFQSRTGQYVEGYITNPDSIEPAIMLIRSSGKGGVSKVLDVHYGIGVVKSITRVMTDNGINAIKFVIEKGTTYGNGGSSKTLSITFEDNRVLNDYNTELTYTPSDIQVGDVILFQCNGSYELEIFHIFYNQNIDEWQHLSNGISYNSTNSSVSMELITDVKGNYIATDDLTASEENVSHIYNLTKPRIVVITDDNGFVRVKEGSVADVVPGDKCIVNIISRSLNTVVIIK